MKVTKKIIASNEIATKSNKEFLVQCVEDYMLEENVLIDFLLDYITEEQAEEIINSLELHELYEDNDDI